MSEHNFRGAAFTDACAKTGIKAVELPGALKLRSKLHRKWK
jgi:hypothetical protein